MECKSCGTDKAFRIRYYTDGSSICNECGLNSTSVVYDVYFDGKPEENLADNPITGKPMVFSSRSEKGRYLKERGIVELGDRVRGAPVSSLDQPSKKDSRPEIQKVLTELKQMNPSVRHQRYAELMRRRGK